MTTVITLLLQLPLIIPLLCLTGISAAPSPAKPGCTDICGDVSIPYPFGIGKDCYFTDYFSIHCNYSSSPPKPFLNHTNLNLELLNVSLEYKTALVNSPITPLCEDNGTWRSAADAAAGSPFRFSTVHNIFMVVGCDTNAVLIADDQDEILAGCTSNCNGGFGGGGCYGIQCCQTTIPYDNQSTHLGIYDVNYTKTSGDCAYAFLGVRDWFANNVSNQGVSTDSGYAPAVVFWEMETVSSGRCWNQKLDWQSETTIESCSCEHRYEGNPYLPNGCRVVEACANCSLLECGMIGDQYYCFPSNGKDKELTAMILGLTIGGGLLLLLIVGSFGLYKGVKKRRERIRKQKFFKRNGGLLLQQQLSSTKTIEKTKIFTSEELEMATDNFSKSRILGKGGQGTVYKGMLNDGRIVAVKKSIIIDESQLKQFINEIMILSQIKHRNIVGLLGCCLETEVPLLVYEFISNGTLFQLIHDKNNAFPWNMRLQIASEAASAIAYLHSSSSTPIYHRDIKSTNILIDEKYRAKVSDFGTSRSISIEQTHLTTRVKGTFGYFDPQYFQSGQFTEKSDVYSFGVVLVELLTGKKPIYWTSSKEEKSLVAQFISSLEEDHTYDILDDRVRKEGEKEKILAIANLTKRCLNLNGKRRPTMKEVMFELEHIRMSSLPINSQQEILDDDDDEYGAEKTMGRLDSAATTSSVTIASNLTYRRSYSSIDV